jgi:hypothetical protein
MKTLISPYLEIDAAALVWLFCDAERGTGERLESREVESSGLAGAEEYNGENPFRHINVTECLLEVER